MCKDSSGVADLTSGPRKLKIIYTLCRNTVPVVLAVVASIVFSFFGGEGWGVVVAGFPSLAEISTFREKKDV